MALLLEQTAVEEKRREMENGGGAATKQLEKTVELAQSASLLYRTASTANKRKLLKILLSNVSVTGKR